MGKQFETKDSGKRQQFSTGMQRDSGDKPLYTEVYAPLDACLTSSYRRIMLYRADLCEKVRCFCTETALYADLVVILRTMHGLESHAANEDLVAGRCLSLDTRYAELMMRGAQKYDRGNWRKAATEEELQRYKDSLIRHTVQYLRGDSDEDHGAAILFNCYGAAMILDKLKEGK
jgi:hypothetical protein